VQPFLDAWRNADRVGFAVYKAVARDLPRPTSCSLAMAGAGGLIG